MAAQEIVEAEAGDVPGPAPVEGVGELVAHRASGGVKTLYGNTAAKRLTAAANAPIDSSMRAGCTVQGKTIKWWLQQSEFARERLFRDPEPIGLRDALSQFRGWYGEPKLTWSHGSNFDLTILDSAYALYDQLPPWRYKDVRDTRTLFWLAHTLRGSNRELMLRPGTKHDALEDALHQATWVQEAYRILMDG